MFPDAQTNFSRVLPLLHQSLQNSILKDDQEIKPIAFRIFVQENFLEFVSGTCLWKSKGYERKDNNSEANCRTMVATNAFEWPNNSGATTEEASMPRCSEEEEALRVGRDRER